MTKDERIKALTEYARVLERNLGSVLSVDLANGLHLALANLLPEDAPKQGDNGEQEKE